MTHTHVLAMRFSSQGTSTGRQLVIPSETSSDDNPIVETKLREFSKGNLLQNDGLDSLNLLTDGSPFYILRTLPKKRYKKMLGNAMIINWSLWWCDCMRFLWNIHAKDPVDLSEGIPTKLIHRSSRVQMRAIVSGPTEEFVQNNSSISRTAHVPYKSQIENAEQKIRLTYIDIQILSNMTAAFLRPIRH